MLGTKRRMEQDADFDAVPLDFLFELDPWLFGEAAGDEQPVAANSRSPAAPGARFAALGADSGLWAPPAGLPTSLAASSANSELSTALVVPKTALKAVNPGSAGATGATAAITATGAPGPPKKKAKPNKSTSQRQKEELTFLRSRVEELELQLTEIKTSNSKLQQEDGKEQEQGEDAEDEDDDADAVPDVQDASLWERIAKRQQEEKTKAEVENMKLREMVEGQIKLVRSFERLLRKRQIWEQLQQDQWQRRDQETKKDDQIFEELLASVEHRSPLLDSIFKLHSLNGASTDGTSANLKYASENGMYLEFIDTKLLPFDSKMIEEVMWRSICEGKFKLDNHQYVSLKHADDVVMSKAVVCKEDTTNKFTNLWSVVKRFDRSDCVEYIYETTVEIPGGGDLALPPVKLVQQGWGRLGVATLKDGSTGTIMQSYSTSVPTVMEADGSDGESSHQQHREIDILTELILTSYQQSRQTIHQSIENLVMDEALARGSNK